MKIFLIISLILIVIRHDLRSQADFVNQKTQLTDKKDSTKVNSLNQLSKIFLSTDLNKAENYAVEALNLSKKLDYPEGEIKSGEYLGVIYRRRGDYSKSHYYIQRSIDIARQNNLQNLLASAYYTMFGLHHIMGRYDSATLCAQQCLDIAYSIEDFKLEAQGNSSLGIISGIQGEHSLAVKYFMKAMKIFEKIGDDPNVANEMAHIGHTFELAGNYPEALKYLKQAYHRQIKINDKFNAAWALMNIGVTYSRMKRDSLALEYYQKAYVIAEEITEHRLILTCLDNIGGWYSTHGDFIKANRYLQKAYNLSENSGYNSRTVYITGNIAENYFLAGELNKAEVFALKHLDLAKQNKIIEEQKVGYYVMSQIYSAQNEFKKAYTVLVEYIKVNDSIFNSEKSEQIERLRTEYQTEKKEQEIALLAEQKANAELRRNIYGILAGIIFILSFFIYYQQRLKNKKDHQILEKEQEVDRLKSRFFANVTHEFRTPLTLILGPIEMMKSETANARVVQHLDVMAKNATRLLSLINQLLDLSKLEARSLQLNVATYDLVPIVKGILHSFESLTESNKINISLNIEETEMEVSFDREKMENVFINLISNAIKYTPNGGEIKILMMIEKSDKEFVNIKIKDSGIGISPDEIKHVFNRFYQADNANIQGGYGTGIGLALVKEVIELHKGTVEVESELGKGTAFSIKLPMNLPVREKNEAVTSSQKPVNSQITHDRSSSTVPEGNHEEEAEMAGSSLPSLLIIEDNDDVRNYIREIMEAQFQVLLARDGEEGIFKALEYIPDIIVSDVMMPKKDGYEVCLSLKQNEITSHIPVILLTAKAGVEDKIQGLENHADDYLKKPFLPKELLVRVHNLIESRRSLQRKYQRELVLRPSEVIVNSIEEVFINKILKIVDENIGNEHFGVIQMAEEVGMSRSQIHRKMMALTNEGPNQFIRAYRLTRAMQLLKKRTATTAEIAYMVGFGSPSYFTKCFRDHYGFTPGEVMP